MTEPTTYTIRTVTDFLAVPSDRRIVCIQEFIYWCAIGDMLKGVEVTTGVKTEMPDAYVWVDDGLHNAAIALVTPDGERTVVMSGVMEGFADKDQAP